MTEGVKGTTTMVQMDLFTGMSVPPPIMSAVGTANSTQVAGTHYKSKAIQPWDYIVGNDLGYLEGNIVKYVSRWKDKGGVDDLKKARHYLDKLIEVNYGRNP